jgi:hypothetical protein
MYVAQFFLDFQTRKSFSPKQGLIDQAIALTKPEENEVEIKPSPEQPGAASLCHQQPEPESIHSERPAAQPAAEIMYPQRSEDNRVPGGGMERPESLQLDEDF